MGVMSLRPPSFKAHFLGSWGFYVFLYQLRKTAVPFHKAWPGSNEDHMHTKLGANPEVKPESRARHCHLPTFSICPFSYVKLTCAPVLWSILGSLDLPGALLFHPMNFRSSFCSGTHDLWFRLQLPGPARLLHFYSSSHLSILLHSMPP